MHLSYNYKCFSLGSIPISKIRLQANIHVWVHPLINDNRITLLSLKYKYVVYIYFFSHDTDNISYFSVIEGSCVFKIWPVNHYDYNLLACLLQRPLRLSGASYLEIEAPARNPMFMLVRHHGTMRHCSVKHFRRQFPNSFHWGQVEHKKTL